MQKIQDRKVFEKVYRAGKQPERDERVIGKEVHN